MVSKLAVLFTLFTGIHTHAGTVHIISDKYSLDSKKVVHVTGEMLFESQFTFDTEMAATIDLHGPRVVYIHSPGGIIDVGATMIEELRQERNRPVLVPYAPNSVVCVVDNQASSMAFNMLTFCDKRLATADAHFVVHKIALGGINPFVRLTAKNLREMADDLDRSDEYYRVTNAAAMHLSLKDYDDYADVQRCWSVPDLYLRHYLDGIVTVIDEN